MSAVDDSNTTLGALIVTHGDLAAELLAATERIVGPTTGILAVSLDWDDPVSGARQRIEAALASVPSERGALIFTDMFGGTPTNVCLPFLEADRVEIITGVNLPMLVKLTTLQSDEASLAEVAQQVRERGQSSVHLASEIVSAPDRK